MYLMFALSCCYLLLSLEARTLGESFFVSSGSISLAESSRLELM